MVNASTEERPANPYNRKKPYISDEEVERGFQGADDSLAYVNKPKTVVSSMAPPLDEEATQLEEKVVEESKEPVETDPTPYAKVDYKKRYDDLKRHYDRKLNEFKQREEELKAEARAAMPKFTPPKTPDELAAFKEEYSDMYGVIESVAHMRAEEQLKELQETVASLQGQIGEVNKGKALAELKLLVPDLDTITSSEDFHMWAEAQPKEVQNWIYNNPDNAQLAARAINLYKYEAGLPASKEAAPKQPPKEEPKPKMPDASEAVTAKSMPEPSGGEKVWTTSEIASMSVWDYDRYAKEIDRAYKEGRVIQG